MSDAPISAKQLQRLADVADMYRTGERIWIAISSDPAGDVFVSENEEEVRKGADRREDFTVHGPFETPPQRAWGWEVVKVEVTVGSISDEQRVIDVDLKTTDALFLTESATEKFAWPYVAQRYGPERAREWFAEYIEDPATSSAMTFHLYSPIRWPRFKERK